LTQRAAVPQVHHQIPRAE